MSTRLFLSSLIVSTAIIAAPAYAQSDACSGQCSSVLDKIFNDVQSISPELRQDIFELINRDVVHGYGDGTFRPQATIARKEFLKLITVPVLQVNSETDASLEIALRRGTLEDIIAKARARNLIPVELRDANLNLPVTRAEAVDIIVATYGLDTSQNTFSTSAFVDIGSPESALAERIELLVEKGIIAGRDSIHFVPEGNLTRAEAAKLAFEAENAFSTEPAASEPDSGLSISAYSVKIVDVLPRNLIGGESATVLFTVSNRHGDPIAGLTFGDDIVVNVTRSTATIASKDEIGNGVYALHIETEKSAPVGPICITINVLRGGPNTVASTCDWTPPEEQVQTSSHISLVRVIPSTIDVGGYATIIATPRTFDGDPVTGLTLKAQVVNGSGTIVQQMAESPAGSGVYIGRFRADYIADDVRIHVYITSSPTLEGTDVDVRVR